MMPIPVAGTTGTMPRRSNQLTHAGKEPTGAVLLSSWALFAGIAILMLGDGLQGTLLGVRASAEGFPTAVTGLVMSTFFLGFLGGYNDRKLVAYNVVDDALHFAALVAVDLRDRIDIGKRQLRQVEVLVVAAPGLNGRGRICSLMQYAGRECDESLKPITRQDQCAQDKDDDNCRQPLLQDKCEQKTDAEQQHNVLARRHATQVELEPVRQEEHDKADQQHGRDGNCGFLVWKAGPEPMQQGCQHNKPGDQQYRVR